MLTNEELVKIANDAVASLFGLTSERPHRGPIGYLALYHVSWKDNDGQNKCLLFKKKKTAFEFYNRMKAEHNGKAGIMKGKYDCLYIYEEGIVEMYEHYNIQDWSFREFKDYVEYHKQFC